MALKGAFLMGAGVQMVVILVIALMLVDTWSASGLAACAPVTHESRAYAPATTHQGPG